MQRLTTLVLSRCCASTTKRVHVSEYEVALDLCSWNAMMGIDGISIYAIINNSDMDYQTTRVLHYAL